GVRVPVVPMAHEYLVTQPFRGDDAPRLPTMRDPDLLVYFREDGRGLVMGGYERAPAPWALDEHAVDRIPADFNGRLLEEDWDRLRGAAFGEKSGWERVNWYEANAAAGDPALRPRGWAGMHWSPAIGAEHVATRERAGLFDESSFAKLEVAGPGAAELLERL